MFSAGGTIIGNTLFLIGFTLIFLGIFVLYFNPKNIFILRGKRKIVIIISSFIIGSLLMYIGYYWGFSWKHNITSDNFIKKRVEFEIILVLAGILYANRIRRYLGCASLWQSRRSILHSLVHQRWCDPDNGAWGHSGHCGGSSALVKAFARAVTA